MWKKIAAVVVVVGALAGFVTLLVSWETESRQVTTGVIREKEVFLETDPYREFIRDKVRIELEDGTSLWHVLHNSGFYDQVDIGDRVHVRLHRGGWSPTIRDMITDKHLQELQKKK